MKVNYATYQELVREGVKATLEGKKVPSLLVLGGPGVGKSQIPRDIAEEIFGESPMNPQSSGEFGGHYFDIRLSLYGPVDVHGMPHVDAANRRVDWIPSTEIPIAGRDPEGGVDVWDEITNISPSMQHMAYQAILDKRIGSNIFPKRRYQIGAGNRVIDQTGAYQMSKALSSRFVIVELEPDLDSWLNWAMTNAVHHTVISFLQFSPASLSNLEKSRKDELTFANPRSWSMISDAMLAYGNDLSDSGLRAMVNGAVGEAVGSEFLAFNRLYGQIPDVEKILNGSIKPVIERPDIRCALAGALADRVSKDFKNANNRKVAQTKLSNLLDWTLGGMGHEISTFMMKMIVAQVNRRYILENETYRTTFYKEFADLGFNKIK